MAADSGEVVDLDKARASRSRQTDPTPDPMADPDAVPVGAGSALGYPTDPDGGSVYADPFASTGSADRPVMVDGPAPTGPGWAERARSAKRRPVLPGWAKSRAD